MKPRVPLPKLAALLVSASALALGVLTGGCAVTTAGDGDSSSQHADDVLITNKVQTAIWADLTLRSLEIQVETVNAVVHLSGYVETPEQKSAADQDASAVAGVMGVRNNLRIRHGSERPEPDILGPRMPQF
jgi:osmotically-inducible protein OsmY